MATRYTAALNDADELAVMLLDVLSGLSEVRIAVAYELDGERLDHFPTDAYVLERCRPVYETLPGWRQDVCGARRFADLPSAARRYVERLGELLELPVTIISVGPDREQTIFTN
jgi:adenylosuccinate synthase